MEMSEEMIDVITYNEQLERLKNIKETLTWDEMQPLHKNENCENLRELKASRDKQKRIMFDLSVENDDTKCMILKKIGLLSDAISWRQAMRDHNGVNANCISLISYQKIANVKDMEARKRIEDMLAEALRRNVHPFSMAPLKYVGITEHVVDDVITFCLRGSIYKLPATRIHLTIKENRLIRSIISKYCPKNDGEKKSIRRVLCKLDNDKRYGWMTRGTK